jgi:hypothetical protein
MNLFILVKNNINKSNIDMYIIIMADSKIPENFQKIITDMADDFTETFPEYSELWIKWTKKNLDLLTEDELSVELDYLYNYIISIYPERFFDIIYHNESIFLPESTETNTMFLPGIDFKLLFNCPDISAQTRKIMWNYLKLILLTVVGTVNDKSKFGGTSNIFDGIDENELFEKLTETVGSMGDFFQNMGNDSTEDSGDNLPEPKEYDISGASLPKVDDIFGHLKGLFDGKIGSLAKSLAEEISGDLSEIFGSDEMGDISSTKDVLGKLMKNPAKISSLLKTINERLQGKISSGEISQEELMKEVADIMAKMKGGEGTNNINLEEMIKNMSKKGGMGEIFKNLSKMGGMGGMEEMIGKMSGGEGGFDINNLMKGMGMGGKKEKKTSEVDTSKMSLHEKMKNRILVKKLKEVENKLIIQNQLEESQKNYVPYDFGNDNNKSFKIDGEEKQGTSSISSGPKKNKKKNKSKK